MFQIDLRSPKPIYEQIVDQVREQVLKGFLRAGDAMPSIRAVSKAATVNNNTVARAYQELERMGLIETVVGRGTFIKDAPQPARDESRINRLFEKMKPPLMELKLMGLHDEDITKEINRLLSALKEENT